jgi:Cu(I)/Ag(I) efflux system membrane fusion protein
MEITTNTETTDHIAQTKRLKVSSKFQTQLKAIFDNYIAIENALVKDNPESAKKVANQLLNTVAAVDMKLLKENTAHNHWMQLEKKLKSSASSISQTTDIKKQREHFIHLSAHLINAVKTFGINQKVYVDFCPMANNNVGAYWLSTNKEIRNPYFGASMLNCGEITDEIN